MTLANAITVLFWLATATLLIGLYRRASVWRLGQPAPVALNGVLAIPKRYFVDLHHVVARDPYIARAHIATAGGAVAALVLVALNYGFAFYDRRIDQGILIAALVMLAGTFFIWWRRQNRPPRLSAGAWDRLPYSLAAFALGLAVVAALPTDTAAPLVSAIALGLLAIGSAELALGIGTGGPMKHAVAGLLHLAFHPRPERFDGVRSTGLHPLPLDANDFGPSKPSDFRWNQLLSFDACVQCGKCEAACPAFDAGQPLNPKKLVQDLVAGMTSESDAGYSGSAYPGIALGTHSGAPNRPIIPGLIEPKTLWSCTTCRACVEECPMLIEHVDAIVGLRRNATLTTGEAPGKAADVLTSLRETGTQTGFSNQQRYNWAIDLDVKTAKPDVPTDILLFAGEGAFDMRYQRTLRALVKVMKAAGLDFAVLGDAERDTGDTARRLGDEATFQTLAAENIATLNALSFKRIVTPDPHVLHSLRNEYPAFGGRYTVVHHTAVLKEIVESGRLSFARNIGPSRITYHDPCYLGRYNGETEAPRDVLEALGFSLSEMTRSRLTARCCGGGGGAPLTDIPGARRIPDMRMDDARATGALRVAVACPQCSAMLEGVTGPRPDVRDIAELVADALEAA